MRSCEAKISHNLIITFTYGAKSAFQYKDPSTQLIFLNTEFINRPSGVENNLQSEKRKSLAKPDFIL